MKKFDFVFWGTPEVASETLEILKQNGFLPSLIVTSPDKPKGRKLEIIPPPVKIWAEKNKIPYIQPEELTPSAFSTSPLLRGRLGGGLDTDLSIVVAYGKIIPENILNMPKIGSINVHYSLLPKYRGASPVESAILNGETETGVTIQKMVYKLDAGPILVQEKVEIYPEEKVKELRARLTKLGADMLVKFLNDSPPDKGELKGVEQDESQATYSKKIKKEDGLINLEAELPSELYSKFRAYHVWPRIYFMKDGKRIIITDATLEDNEFVIKKIITEGSKETDYKESKKPAP